MTTSEVTVDRVPVSMTVLDRLRGFGVDVDEVLRRAGLGAGRFTSGGKARLSTREFFALWASVEAQTQGQRDLGLRLGVQAVEQGYASAMHAALLAPNLGEALEKLARYKKIVCPEHVQIAVKSGLAHVRFHWILAETQVPRLLVDATFASFLELARRGTGSPVVPRRVELARRRGDGALLEAHFGCEVTFAAPHDRIVWSAEQLALPFATHDAPALSRLVPALELALGEHRAAGLFVDELRVVVARQMYGGRPSVDRVARELRLSARTLQRRLEEANTSFQAELDDVRQKTARRLLANTDLDAAEVAFFLGFEEPNSFARAFRGWEGMTPTRWRDDEDRELNGRAAQPFTQ